MRLILSGKKKWKLGIAAKFAEAKKKYCLLPLAWVFLTCARKNTYVFTRVKKTGTTTKYMYSFLLEKVARRILAEWVKNAPFQPINNKKFYDEPYAARSAKQRWATFSNLVFLFEVEPLKEIPFKVCEVLEQNLLNFFSRRIFEDFTRCWAKLLFILFGTFSFVFLLR